MPCSTPWREAYRGLLMVGRYAIAFLSIEMPPDMVNVNVHPTKLEVRFRDGGRLYSQLLSTLRSKFLTTDLTTQAQAPPGSEDPSGGARRDAGGPVAAGTRRLGQGQGRRLAAAGQPASDRRSQRNRLADEPGPAASRSSNTRCPRPTRPRSAGRWNSRGSTCSGPPCRPNRAAGAAATYAGRRPHATARRARSMPRPRPPQALQIHNRYLVTETHEGVTIIDQHALHERILFEQLRARIDAGALETQSLLVPEPVDLSPAEAAIALEHRDVLGQLGLRIEPFGGDTVLIAGFPAMLANMNPARSCTPCWSGCVSGGGQPDRRDLLDDMLHTVACKAAIKAGDRLTAAEIAALLGAAAHGTNGEGHWSRGVTRNISYSGVLFHGEDWTEPGTHLEMCLVLPGGISGEWVAEVVCRGTVTRSERSGSDGDGPLIASIAWTYRISGDQGWEKCDLRKAIHDDS